MGGLARATGVAAAFLVPLLSAQTHREEVYATVGGTPLHVELHLPASPEAGPHPTVIWIHGGAWTTGSRRGLHGAVLDLLDHGIAIASVQYRLTSQAGQFGAEPVIWPAQIHDVKGAVRFLRARAGELTLDPTRFGAWGESAGGHLAAVLGTSGGVASLEGVTGGHLDQPSDVHAVASFYGPTDLFHFADDVRTPPGCILDIDAPDSVASMLFGFTGPGEGLGVLRANRSRPIQPFLELGALVESANPITYVDPRDPPTYLVHGEEDRVVPWRQSQRLFDALTAAGVEARIEIIPGADHHPPPPEFYARTHAFFTRHLGQPASP